MSEGSKMRRTKHVYCDSAGASTNFQRITSAPTNSDGLSNFAASELDNANCCLLQQELQHEKKQNRHDYEQQHSEHMPPNTFDFAFYPDAYGADRIREQTQTFAQMQEVGHTAEYEGVFHAGSTQVDQDHQETIREQDPRAHMMRDLTAVGRSVVAAKTLPQQLDKTNQEMTLHPQNTFIVNPEQSLFASTQTHPRQDPNESSPELNHFHSQRLQGPRQCQRLPCYPGSPLLSPIPWEGERCCQQQDEVSDKSESEPLQSDGKQYPKNHQTAACQRNDVVPVPALMNFQPCQRRATQIGDQRPRFRQTQYLHFMHQLASRHRRIQSAELPPPTALADPRLWLDHSFLPPAWHHRPVIRPPQSPGPLDLAHGMQPSEEQRGAIKTRFDSCNAEMGLGSIKTRFDSYNTEMGLGSRDDHYPEPLPHAQQFPSRSEQDPPTHVWYHAPPDSREPSIGPSSPKGKTSLITKYSPSLESKAKQGNPSLHEHPKQISDGCLLVDMSDDHLRGSPGTFPPSSRQRMKDSPCNNKPTKRHPTPPHGKPKKARTAYNFFFRDQRRKILEEKGHFEKSALRKARKKNPHHKIDFKELGRLIGTRWNQLSVDSRRPYQELAEADKRRYEEELDEFREKHRAQLTVLQPDS